MASEKLLEIISEAETLSTSEQLELIARLAEKARHAHDESTETNPHPQWKVKMRRNTFHA